jgi:hypothetical protein
MTPLYLLIKVFQKFDPLTVTGMALCVDCRYWAEQNRIALSLRLGGIESNRIESATLVHSSTTSRAREKMADIYMV